MLEAFKAMPVRIINMLMMMGGWYCEGGNREVRHYPRTNFIYFSKS